MFDFWETELSEAETETLLGRLADEVGKRRLQVPAVLALEMHKPLAGVFGATGMVCAPFLIPIFGFDRVNDYTRLLSTSANVERLIVKIENWKPLPPESRPKMEEACSPI
jgi:hypothetical protein